MDFLPSRRRIPGPAWPFAARGAVPSPSLASATNASAFTVEEDPNDGRAPTRL
jgi:hypothetical protein